MYHETTLWTLLCFIGLLCNVRAGDLRSSGGEAVPNKEQSQGFHSSTPSFRALLLLKRYVPIPSANLATRELLQSVSAKLQATTPSLHDSPPQAREGSTICDGWSFTPRPSAVFSIDTDFVPLFLPSRDCFEAISFSLPGTDIGGNMFKGTFLRVYACV